MSASCNRGSTCSLTRAMDGRIVRCGIISQSAATCEIVKRFWSRTHVRRAITSIATFTFTFTFTLSPRIAGKPSVLCCHLANTNEALGGLAAAIPHFAKLLRSLLHSVLWFCRDVSASREVTAPPSPGVEKTSNSLLPVKPSSERDPTYSLGPHAPYLTKNDVYDIRI